MPLLPTSLIETISSTRSTQPRTILGFLFAVCGVAVGAGVLFAIEAIGTRSGWLVGPVLFTVALLVFGIVIGVFRQADRNPAGLMLGQVTGDEYRQIRELTLGDSAGGERRVVGPIADPTVVEGSASDEGLRHQERLGSGQADDALTAESDA
jgi:hypothetical protein